MMAKERALGNHVQYIWRYGVYLLCELVPFRDVAIGIAQISNMKNHLIVCNIFDKLISCIKSSMLVLVVRIWAISFILSILKPGHLLHSLFSWCTQTDGQVQSWKEDARWAGVSMPPYLTHITKNDNTLQWLFTRDRGWCEKTLLAPYMLTTLQLMCHHITISEVIHRPHVSTVGFHLEPSDNSGVSWVDKYVTDTMKEKVLTWSLAIDVWDMQYEIILDPSSPLFLQEPLHSQFTPMWVLIYTPRSQLPELLLSWCYLCLFCPKDSHTFHMYPLKLTALFMSQIQWTKLQTLNL